MKGMIKDAVILFAITLVAALSLGVVNEVTKEPIALAKEQAKQQACQEVFTDAASFEKDESFDVESTSAFLLEQGYTAVDIDEILYARDSADTLLGYVVTVTDHEGYGGDIQFSMGITVDGVLNGISLLSISETAGLGMEADKVLVPQFAEKQVTQFAYTKSGATSDFEIDAISGATITTSAIIDGVNAGLTYYQAQLEGGNGHE